MKLVQIWNGTERKKFTKAYFVIVILIEDWAVFVKPASTTILWVIQYGLVSNWSLEMW